MAHRRIVPQKGTRKSAAKELGSVLDWDRVLDSLGYVDGTAKAAYFINHVIGPFHQRHRP
jgi:hypothetical protein